MQDHSSTNQNEEETRILLFYRGQLEELTVCMQQIAIEWQMLKDTLDANEWSPHAYRAIAVPTGA